MKKGLVGTIMAIVLIALVIVVVVLEIKSDKDAPEITYSEQEMVYNMAEDKALLLTDVTAYDEVDGDVTENLTVESIYDFHNGTAQVIYVAKDDAGNICKKSRIVKLTDAATGVVPQETTGAAVENEPVEDVQGEAAEPEWHEVTGVNPVINLTTDLVTIAVGDSSFNRMNYIAGMADDVDDESVLSRRVRIDGDYDIDVPGTYTLTYYVSDTDGNMSNRAVLTLVVQ